jgi:hypothetical protein
MELPNGVYGKVAEATLEEVGETIFFTFSDDSGHYIVVRVSMRDFEHFEKHDNMRGFARLVLRPRILQQREKPSFRRWQQDAAYHAFTDRLLAWTLTDDRA